MTAAQALRISTQRRTTGSIDGTSLVGAAAILRAQLVAQDAQLLECCARLAIANKELREWQRIAAERAERIVALEHRLPQE